MIATLKKSEFINGIKLRKNKKVTLRDHLDQFFSGKEPGLFITYKGQKVLLFMEQVRFSFDLHDIADGTYDKYRNANKEEGVNYCIDYPRCRETVSNTSEYCEQCEAYVEASMEDSFRTHQLLLKKLTMTAEEYEEKQERDYYNSLNQDILDTLESFEIREFINGNHPTILVSASEKNLNELYQNGEWFQEAALHKYINDNCFCIIQYALGEGFAEKFENGKLIIKDHVQNKVNEMGACINDT